MIDDAHTVDADPGRLCQLLARLRARLASHLAHEEANALPLISQILTPANSAESPKPSAAGHSIRHARTTIPWALTGADPDVREQVLSQLPAGTRPYPGPDSLAAVPRSHRPAAENDTWPGAAVTAGDTASSPLAAVSPADRGALLPGRPTEPALWALVINHADCSESGLDPDQWFPVSADHGRARQEAAAAIAICTTCPVRGDCLTLSLRRWDSGQHGVWGGLVAADRARLRRRAHPPAAGRRNGR